MNKLILIFVLFANYNVIAQSTFNKLFEDKEGFINTHGTDITEGVKGDLYCLASSWNLTKRDIRLTKLNKNGVLQWDTTYTFTPNGEYQCKMIPAYNGGVIVACLSYSWPLPDQDSIQDILVWYINPSGTIVWQKILKARSFKDITSTTDRNYIILGTEYNNGLDFLAYKISMDGDVIWKNSYGEEKDSNRTKSWEEPFGISRINDELYLFGERSNGNGNGSDGLIYKINHDGDLLWELIRERDDSNTHTFVYDVFTIDNKFYFRSLGLYKFNSESGEQVNLSDLIPWKKFIVENNCFNNSKTTAIFYNIENNTVQLHEHRSIDSIKTNKLLGIKGSYVHSIRTKDGGYAILTNGTSSFKVLKLDCQGNEFWSDECNSKIPKDTEILLYPNPSSETLNIEATYDFNLVEITDLKGAQVHIKNSCKCNKQSIDIGLLSSGFYTITIIGDENRNTNKFVKY